MNKVQQNFSVSKKYDEVYQIIDEIRLNKGNKSEFICQAIIEKYARENGGNQGINKSDLREEIKSVLGELMLDDMFIVKGNPDGIIPMNFVQAVNGDVSGQNSDTKSDEPIGELDEETTDTLKDISGGW